MTNVKKERGNLDFKRLLSDRHIRSKAGIYLVFIMAMLIEVNHRKQSWRCLCNHRVDVYIFNTHIYISMYIWYFKSQLVIQPVTITHSGFLWGVSGKEAFSRWSVWTLCCQSQWDILEETHKMGLMYKGWKSRVRICFFIEMKQTHKIHAQQEYVCLHSFSHWERRNLIKGFLKLSFLSC